MALVAGCGVLCPGAYLFIAYRTNAPWFPPTNVPWSQLLIVTAISLALVTAVAGAIRAIESTPWERSIVLAIAVCWPLWISGRAVAVDRFLNLGSWTAPLAFALLYGLWLFVIIRILRSDGVLPLAAVIVSITLVTIAPSLRVFTDLTPPFAATADFEVTETRRTWILVFDELAAAEFLKEIDPVHGGDAQEALSAAGFVVSEDARSPYPSTYPSLGSILSLEPLEPGTYFGDDLAPQAAVFLGEHPLAASYREAGREVVMIRPPISAARCGELVTQCHQTTMDDFGNYVRRSSIIGLLNPSSGISFWPASAVRQFEVLEHIASEQGAGELIYAHLLIPHAPFTLSPDCATGDVVASTKSGYARNVQCFSRLLISFLAALPQDDIVLMIGDHGLKIESNASIKTPEIIETVDSAFVAIRGCDESSDYLGSNVNAYRALVNCVTDADLPAIEPEPVVACFADQGRRLTLLEAIPDPETGVVSCA